MNPIVALLIVKQGDFFKGALALGVFKVTVTLKVTVTFV